jgi:hypothetical protein
MNTQPLAHRAPSLRARQTRLTSLTMLPRTPLPLPPRRTILRLAWTGTTVQTVWGPLRRPAAVQSRLGMPPDLKWAHLSCSTLNPRIRLDATAAFPRHWLRKCRQLSWFRSRIVINVFLKACSTSLLIVSGVVSSTLTGCSRTA